MTKKVLTTVYVQFEDGKSDKYKSAKSFEKAASTRMTRIQCVSPVPGRSWVVVRNDDKKTYRTVRTW